MSKIESCVVQEQKRGCGAACLATILEVDYWTVANAFQADLNEEGLSGQILMDYLAGYGFDLVSKAAIYYGNGYKIISDRILRPFADIHILAGYQSIEATRGKSEISNGHWLIMDEEGTIFCPSDGKKANGNYLVFDLNIGIFYPRYWKYEKEKQDALDSSSSSNNSGSN